MAIYSRKRKTLQWSIWLSVGLMTISIGLMVCWIILSIQLDRYPALTLTVGTISFVLILVGLSFYLVLTIKEVRLNQRQANFVDSVTHELKTPIASLKLYLETLQMRNLEDAQRSEFYGVMEQELKRLDHLINQLLEVARLDAIGHGSDPEDIELEPLLRRCAAAASVHHKRNVEDVFEFDIEPVVIRARRIVLEMVFGNLLDNAVKYGGESPQVEVRVRAKDSGRVVTHVSDNGAGVPYDIRKKIFRMFYRGGDELQRTKKGTGLGLYIVRTLVHILRGKITVHDRIRTPGTVFEVELPGRASECES